jgi:hypothetical protein
MTKEEAIKEAYGEYWEQVKVFVDENGWVFFSDDENILRLNFQQKDNISTEKTDVESWKWRPKSLQGIENNNGWIKGTPKEDMYCHILFSDGTQSIDRFLKEHGNFICHHYKSVTHYQPIEKRKPPIY